MPRRNQSSKKACAIGQVEVVELFGLKEAQGMIPGHPRYRYEHFENWNATSSPGVSYSYMDGLLIWSIDDIVLQIDRFTGAVANWKKDTEDRLTLRIQELEADDPGAKEANDYVAEEYFDSERVTELAFASTAVAIAAHIEVGLWRIWKATRTDEPTGLKEEDRAPAMNKGPSSRPRDGTGVQRKGALRS